MAHHCTRRTGCNILFQFLIYSLRAFHLWNRVHYCSILFVNKEFNFDSHVNTNCVRMRDISGKMMNCKTGETSWENFFMCLMYRQTNWNMICQPHYIIPLKNTVICLTENQKAFQNSTLRRISIVFALACLHWYILSGNHSFHRQFITFCKLVITILTFIVV